MKEERAKLYFWISSVIIVAATALLFFIGYQLYAPMEVIQINEEPFTVTEEVIKVGEQIYFTLDFCKLREATAIINYELVRVDNGFKYLIPSTQGSSLGVGCYVTNSTSQFAIPEIVEPGDYRFNIRVEYKLNELRAKTYIFESTTFRVEK